VFTLDENLFKIPAGWWLARWYLQDVELNLGPLSTNVTGGMAEGRNGQNMNTAKTKPPDCSSAV